MKEKNNGLKFPFGIELQRKKGGDKKRTIC